jgi:hypothetical protein
MGYNDRIGLSRKGVEFGLPLEGGEDPWFAR